jgi:hypothetical protein
MTPEGMVHALEEIHRLLMPGGILIDIHPYIEASRIEVYQAGRLLFTQPKPGDCAEGFHQADDALAQAVRRRLYILESSGQFDYLVYSSSVIELCDYHEAANAYDTSQKDEVIAAQEAEVYARADKILQSAGKGAELATHEKVHVARLRPIS